MGATTRYFGLLEVLLERVATLLSSRPGAHDVRVLQLSRPIRDSTIDHRVQANVFHLGEIINRVRATAGTAIHLVPWEVPFYDPKVDPALVIADFIASNTRGLLGQYRTPLARIEEDLARQVGLTSRVGRASAIAAAGSAATYVAAVRQGREAGMWGVAGKRLWAYEQALEWADLIRSAR